MSDELNDDSVGDVELVVHRCLLSENNFFRFYHSRKLAVYIGHILLIEHVPNSLKIWYRKRFWILCETRSRNGMVK